MGWSRGMVETRHVMIGSRSLSLVAGTQTHTRLQEQQCGRLP